MKLLPMIVALSLLACGASRGSGAFTPRSMELMRTSGHDADEPILILRDDGTIVEERSTGARLEARGVVAKDGTILIALDGAGTVSVRTDAGMKLFGRFDAHDSLVGPTDRVSVDDDGVPSWTAGR